MATLHADHATLDHGPQKVERNRSIPEIYSGIEEYLLHKFRADSPHFEVTECSDRYTIHGDVPGVHREHLTLHALNQHTLSVECLAKPPQKARNGDITVSNSLQQKNLKNTEPSLAEQCLTDPFDVDKVDAVKENDDIEGTGNSDNFDGDYIDPLCRCKKHEDAIDLTVSRSVSTATRKDSLSNHRHQFHQTFHFADPIDIEKIKASLHLGTLHVEAPKAVAHS